MDELHDALLGGMANKALNDLEDAASAAYGSERDRAIKIRNVLRDGAARMDAALATTVAPGPVDPLSPAAR